MIYNSVLVRFTGEFGVKSAQTQDLLETLLRRNIQNALAATGNGDLLKRLQIQMRSGRYYLMPRQPTEADVSTIVSIVGRTFGISSISPCFHSPASDKTATRTIPAKLMLAQGIYPRTKKIAIRAPENAGIDTKQWKGEILALCDKFSQEEEGNADNKKDISRKRFHATDRWLMGPWACQQEKQLEIEVFENIVFISAERIKAPGGFPLGLEDPLVALVSGGFDSPVAAWMALRRGVPLIFVIMDPADEENHNGDSGGSVRTKALKQVWILTEYMRGLPSDPIVLVMPYGKVLSALQTQGAQLGVTCLLCKRMMYRVAEQVAHMYGAKGIVTGEILGEQASQTAQNLMILNKVATIPVHRPLFGFDKEEVVTLSRQIGTAPVASISSPPCRGVPDHPQIRGEMQDIEDLERQLDVDQLIQQCLQDLNPIRRDEK
ncbi:MAG: thiamine biosynthesis protein ThiI [Promethearchaeota archaeon CR_4]|nr:MAG: thiamine biosynthesis protein ThiI [Candidatus Lokiarchaeota archaeon CR_4]